MPPPLLLVHDDLATIASVRKALTRAGHSVQLATSTADAVTAFDHLAPSLVLLAPAVEGGQGPRFLADLRARPAGAVTPVLLLGGGVQGSRLPVLSLPVHLPSLLEAVESALNPPDADDLPLLDQGQMEELPPLVEEALAQAEADLEAEVFAGLHAMPELPPLDAPPAGQAAQAAEARTLAAREEAELARQRADAAESARAAAEEARARAEGALRAHQRAEAEERARRTDAEARAQSEADEVRRLEAEAGEARARVEAAQADARAAQAQGTAEAELLAAALREEAARRTRELATQERLREEAEARAEREAQARAEAESRASAEVARLAVELRAREEEAQRAREEAALELQAREAEAQRSQAESEARAAQEAVRLAAEAQASEEAARRARAEADAWAAREREALALADRAREQAQALEVEAAHLAERLAQGERAALEALARAEEALRRERATGEALRGELAAARAGSDRREAPVPAPARSLAPSPEPKLPVRRGEPRPSSPLPPPAASSSPGWSGEGAAARLEWGAADGGRVTLEQLAALMLRLQEVQATARLELRADTTLRILWLAEGALVGAASTHPAESLVQRALADGLLDEATAAELRSARLPDETMVAELVERGVLREAEVVPLLQRCTEVRALEALSERDTTYRLAADASPPGGGCAPARPLAAVLAEALRRALPPEEVESRVHGGRATPRPLRRLDLGPFEFGDRERRLLEAVDGERTVLELLTRTGIRQDAGLRALAVAEVLGLLQVIPPESTPAPEVAPEVELERLEAKWASAEEADYFTVLGVPRTAGTEEVQRAHARLAAEFDPLRYAGHPDPDVPMRAARLQTLLDEAAQALTDERLRTAYARSLVDGEGGSRAT